MQIIVAAHPGSPRLHLPSKFHKGRTRSSVPPGLKYICSNANKSSFKTIDEWIDNYYKYKNPDSEKNVVLIGNKVDLVDKREITQEEVEDYVKMNNILYFETSAKEGKNIDECFNYIAEKLLKQSENKNNELYKKKDVIKNNSLKEKTLVIIGEKKKCCFI